MTVMLQSPYKGQNPGTLYTGPEEAALVARGDASLIAGTEATGRLQAAQVDAAGDTTARAVAILAQASAGGPTVAALGDSITVQARGGSGPGWTNIGYLSWARWLNRQSFRTTPTLVFAQTGWRTDQIVTDYLPGLLAAKPNIAIIHAGKNDVTQGIAPATTIANLTTMYQVCVAAGIRVIAVPLSPETSGGLTANQQNFQAYVNQWIARYCRTTPGMMYADANAAFMDYSTGLGKVGYYYDSPGRHPGPTGAYFMGKAVAAAVSRIIGPTEDLTFSLNDAYDATFNPAGNRLPAGAGLFAGTAGTAGLGTTGPAATGWNIRALATTGVTVALSKEAAPNVTGLERQVFTLGGTSEASPITIRTTPTATLATTGLNAGDWVEGEIEVSFSGLTGVSLLQLNIAIRDAANAQTLSIDGFGGASNGPWPTVSDTILMRTNPLIMPAGLNSPGFTFDIVPMPNASMAGTVKIGLARLRKIA